MVTGRHVGLLIVEVVEAVDLHKQDVFGKADPLVSVWTQGTRKETTVSRLCPPALFQSGQ